MKPKKKGFHMIFFKKTALLKFPVNILKFDKKQNPLKSIAEIFSSLQKCIWIVCTTSELACGKGRGAKVSKHPVH